MIPPMSHTPAKLNSQEGGQSKNMLLSEYEQSREERIKQNLERMQKLGIFDLSLKLKSLKPAPPNSKPSSTRRNLQHFSPLPPPVPIRRSSRLQNATPVSYSEVHLTREDNPLDNGHDLLREEGSRPEVYTEEHEKLLGNTEMSWTLFVDGFGKDGKRIYDPVNGKTCHQCRQKTLGHRTHCSKCNKLQGQFCGDCLYMRYGEHVLEANQNSNWICPVCRDICNCSLCRQSKGWPPTGTLYRKVSSLGFKSVAHYLLQTRRSNSDLKTNSGTKLQTSVKRSLPFSDVEEILIDKISSKSNVKLQGLECPQSEGKTTDDCLDDGKQEQSADSLNNKDGDGKSELIMQPELGEIAIKKVSSESNVKPQGLEYPQSEGNITYNCLDDGKQKERPDFLNSKQGEGKVECSSELLTQHELPTNCNTENSLLLGEMGKEMELHVCSKIRWENSAASLKKLVFPKTCSDEKGTTETELESRAENLKDFGQRQLGCFIAPQASTRSNKNHGHTSELPDSIAGRLRLRRKTGKEHEEEMATGQTKGTADIKRKLNNKKSPPCKAEATANHSNSATPDVVAVTDSIAGRLRQRRNQGNHQYEEQGSAGAKDGIPDFKAEASLNPTNSTTPPEVAPTRRSNSNKKRVRDSEPSPDSIAGRLRERRAGVKVM